MTCILINKCAGLLAHFRAFLAGRCDVVLHAIDGASCASDPARSSICAVVGATPFAFAPMQYDASCHSFKQVRARVSRSSESKLCTSHSRKASSTRFSISGLPNEGQRLWPPTRRKNVTAGSKFHSHAAYKRRASIIMSGGTAHNASARLLYAFISRAASFFSAVQALICESNSALRARNS